MASNRLLPLWKSKIPRYPVYLKGNPQNRIFLCQFWMKMLKPPKGCPPGKVHFIVHPQMTKFDIKQYLEKIYNVPVLTVKTKLNEGNFIENPLNRQHSIAKEDDYKVAHVILADGHTFEFPEIDPPSVVDDQHKQMDIKKRDGIIELHKKWERITIPPWFRS